MDETDNQYSHPLWIHGEKSPPVPIGSADPALVAEEEHCLAPFRTVG